MRWKKRQRPPSSWPVAALLLVSLAFTGCISGSTPFQNPTPSDVPELERRVQRDSTELESVGRLAAAYSIGGRPEDAYALLSFVQPRIRGDLSLSVALGAMAQELGQPAEAAALYSGYLRRYQDSLASQVAARLATIEEDAVRSVLSEVRRTQEQTESSLRDNGVVLLPFSTPEASMDTLATALSWLMARELERHMLQVVPAVQARVASEMTAASPEEVTRASIGMEIARLLGARHAVQAELRPGEGGGLVWSVSTLSIGDEGSVQIAPLTVELQADEALQVVPDVVELVRRSIRREPFVPPPGEELDQRREPPLQFETLLQMGRGLVALRQDSPAAARSHFAAAQEAEPELTEARQFAEQAAAMAAVAAVPLSSTALEAIRLAELRRAVLALQARPQRRGGPGAGSGAARSPVPEVLGLDRIGSGALLDIVFVPVTGGAP